MELYTGKIHSEQIVDSSGKHHDFANSHEIVKSHVTFYISKYALETATNILRIRNPILLLARDSGQESKFILLKEYHLRSLQGGF